METSIIKAKKLIYRTLKNDMQLIEHLFDVYGLTSYFYAELSLRLKEKFNHENLLLAALLHDIGKSSIAGELLNKPGELNIFERESIKQHAENGKKILEKTSFRNVADYVYYHHERVDGTGYYGLSGEQIPIESKIISIIDTYSALTTDRVYRKSCSVNEALQTLRTISGTQLDKILTDNFCEFVEKRHQLCF